MTLKLNGAQILALIEGRNVVFDGKLKLTLIASDLDRDELVDIQETAEELINELDDEDEDLDSDDEDDEDSDDEDMDEDEEPE